MTRPETGEASEAGVRRPDVTYVRDIEAVIRYVGGDHDGDLDVYRVASMVGDGASFRNPPLVGTPKQPGYVVEEIRSAFTPVPATPETRVRDDGGGDEGWSWWDLGIADNY